MDTVEKPIDLTNAYVIILLTARMRNGVRRPKTDNNETRITLTNNREFPAMVPSLIRFVFAGRCRLTTSLTFVKAIDLEQRS